MIQETSPGLGRILRNRKCTAFAGACVLLLMSGSLVGMSMMALGEQTDLATGESARQWRAEDVFLQPCDLNDLQYWGWHTRKPVVLDPTGFEIPFNDLSTDQYTVYVHNSWEGNLEGMEIIATVSIRADSGDPQFITRTPGYDAYVRLEFQSTPGPYDEFDYWWCYECVALDDLVGDTFTFSVPLEGALWQCIWGGWTGEVYPVEFDYAMENVHEVGFSFGRLPSWASGAAATGGEATFVVESYVIQPVQ
jgi:hypothetical protein